MQGEGDPLAQEPDGAPMLYAKLVLVVFGGEVNDFVDVYKFKRPVEDGNEMPKSGAQAGALPERRAIALHNLCVFLPSRLLDFCCEFNVYAVIKLR